MKRLYAPWRHDYVTGKEKKDSKNLKNNCVFCDQFAQNNDEKYFILKRLQHCVVIMNYYPYNAGHVMILPYQHLEYLDQVPQEARAEMMEATTMATSAIKKALNCEGFNVGINLGAAGGGGLREHLHIHVLPRWKGDTNFLSTLVDTTLVCTDMQEVYTALKKEFDLV
ncbi:MAG: HIT domain-containing protein [bacterium]